MMDTLVRIAGGVALLVWGLHMTRTGLLRGFGARLRQAIGRSGNGRFTSFGVGVAIAALLQSSLATITIAASLCGRGMLTAGTALIVALGADLGSALAAQLIAIDIGWLSPLLITIGVTIFETAAHSGRRNLGRATIGVGLILLSLSLMKAAFAPLAASAVLTEVLTALAGQPALLVLLAAAMTLLAHSSLAIVAIVTALATAGVLAPLPSLFMVLGANLGAGLAAALATRAMPPPIRIAPMANLLARSTGVAVAFVLLLAVSPNPIAIAPQHLVLGAHLAFNLLVGLAALPFTGRLVSAATSLIPKPVADPSAAAPLHLDDSQLASSELAIGNARREVVRMADAVQTMLGDIARLLQSHDAGLEKSMALAEDGVDAMHRAIKRYAADFLRLHGEGESARQMLQALEFATDLEHIGDIIMRSLLAIANRKNRSHRSFSEAGMREILLLHEMIMRNMKMATNAFIAGDQGLADNVIAAKRDVRNLVQASADAHFSRIVDRSDAALQTSGLHVDVLRDLKRINSHLVAASYRTLGPGRDAVPPDRELVRER